MARYSSAQESQKKTTAASEEKKHILVVSQYFYPEQFRINDIATEWVNRGYKVTVLTGIPNYPEGKYYPTYGLFKQRTEKYNGMDIIRIPLVPRGSNSIMMVLNYFSFVVSGWIWKIFTKLRADYVFIFEVSPMTQALPGIWYGKKHKIPVYMYVQDLWPETIEIVAGVSNKIILKYIGNMVDYIYRSCDKIFTTSGSFIDIISGRGHDREKIGFWPQYAEDFYQPLSRESAIESQQGGLPIPQDGALNISFAGNIGNAQGLEILPEVARKLQGQTSSRVRFNIIGNGRYKASLQELVKEKNVEEFFNFIQARPAEEVPILLAISDVALISLADSSLFAMTIPAKLQSYMACGVPILGVVIGEVAHIIEESQSGLSSRPGDVDGLVNNIIKILGLSKEELIKLGNNARRYNNVNFNKIKLLDEMDEYFNFRA